MTRRMADSVTPANLPAGFDLYGGYDDGSFNNVAAIVARFPGKTVLHFTVFAKDNFGDCLDVESGDATPAQAPGWVTLRRQAGHGGPLVYCSESAWPSVRAAFVAANVAQPGYIVAGYPGAEGDAIPSGAVGHQWIDRGPYDESIVVDYLPGIDPAPNPAPGPIIYPEDNVTKTPITVAIASGKGWAPSPVPAGNVINVVFSDENPEVVGRYDNLPTLVGVATQTSKDAPNGTLNFEGTVNGTFGAVVWSAA